MHENMHQIIAGLNGVAFNVSDEGWGVGHFGGHGNYGGGFSGCSHGQGCPSASACSRLFAPNAYGGGFPAGRGSFPPAFGGGRFQGFIPQGPPHGFPQVPPVCLPPGPGPPSGLGPQPYQAPGTHYVAPGTSRAHTQQQPFSNTVKPFSNWNVTYSCGFNA
jgi:hypothetical protein